MAIINSIFDYIEKIVSDFSWRRLIIFITIICLVIGGIVFYEAYTDHFKLSRLQKTTELMTKIAFLEREYGLSKNTYFKKSYTGLTDELNQLLIIGSPASIGLSQKIRFAFAGAFLWLIFGLIFIPKVRKGEKNSLAGLIGILIFGVFAGTIAFHIPKLLNGYFNYIIYPIGNFALLLSLVIIWQTKKK